MKNKPNNVPVLQRIAEAARSDAADLITEYESAESGFSRFKEVWKLRQFSCIHHACPDKLYYGVYLQILFDSIINLNQSSAANSVESELRADANGSTIVFLLFCLHQTQLHGDRPLFPIIITTSQLSTLQNSVDSLGELAGEARDILNQMLRDNCSVLGTYSGAQCIHYAEKHKTNRVDSTPLLSYSSMLQVSSTSINMNSNLDSVMNVEEVEKDDVIAKLEELIPARRAHKRLVAETVMERRRSRQAAAAQKLSETLSKMSQPKPTRRMNRRITSETAAVISVKIDPAASATGGAASTGSNKRNKNSRSYMTIKADTTKGFEDFNGRGAAAGGNKKKSRVGKKQQQQQDNNDEEEGPDAEVVGRSLVDDLEEMIRQSGEAVKPPPQRRGKRGAVSTAVATTTGGTGSSSSASSSGAATARVSSSDRSSSGKKVRAKKSAAPAVPRGKKDANTSSGRRTKKTSGSESVLELLEELERDTAEALTGRTSVARRRKHIVTANDKDTSTNAVGEGGLSVLAMVEELERDSAEALVGGGMRRQGGAGSRKRKRRQSEVSTESSSNGSSGASKKKKTAKLTNSDVIDASSLPGTTSAVLTAAVAEMASSVSVLDMLQELEQDSSHVLASAGREGSSGTIRKTRRKRI